MSLSTISSTSVESNLHQDNKYDRSQNSFIQSVSSGTSSVLELPEPPVVAQDHPVHQLSTSSNEDDYNFSDGSDLQPGNEAIQPSTPSIQLQHPEEQERIYDFATTTPRQDIETSRPRSARSIRTRIGLTSGKSLVLQLNPSAESVVKDITK